MAKLLDRKTLKHRQKRYETYLLESQPHNQSIIDKYGASPIARPPLLADDVIERVIAKTDVTKQEWNGRYYDRVPKAKINS